MLRAILVTLLALISTVEAQVLNVFHDDAAARVVIDGKTLDSNQIYNYKVQAGSHLVRVVLDDQIIFSKVVQVPAGEIQTVDTNTFVGIEGSKIPDAGPATLEKRRLEDLKGKFGIGFQFASVTGVSFKQHFRPATFQLAGWYSSSDDSELYGYNPRILFPLSDKLTKVDTRLELYGGFGYGKIHVDDSIEEYYTDIYELILGIEHPTRVGYFTYNIVFRNYKKDYRRRYESDWFDFSGPDNKTGIVINLGYHYYF